MNLNSKIYVAGHRGMVGSAIVRHLHQLGYKNIVTKTSKELNLMRQDEVEKFFEEERPEFVFLAKLLDVSLLKSTGWTSSTDLKEGIKKVYQWYVSQLNK